MSQNIYRCTPRQVRRFIEEYIWPAKLVPMVTSSPGMGKSTIIRNIINAYNLHLIDHRASTSQPEDFTGLPEFVTVDQGTEYERRIATFTPFDLFPTTRTPKPKGKDGWAIFLDEFNSAEKEIQAASYKLALDRMVGQFHLHPDVVIAMAGNLMTDRAIVTELSTAMQSRLVHIEMEFSFREWWEDVAMAENYDDRIMAYANWDNDFVMDFKPDHQDKTFNCPRTIEFANRMIKTHSDISNLTPLLAGTMASGHAAAFVQFCEVYKELTTIDDVLRDPMSAPVPERGSDSEQERKWAIIVHLMKKANEKNFTDITKYVDRFDTTFQIMYYRSTVHQLPELRRHPAYAQAMIRLGDRLK